MTSHSHLDQRSLAMHRIAAEKLRQDESLLGKVQDILDHWYATASPRTHSYLDEWQSLVRRGASACISVAIEESQRAEALRQASPLACLLSNAERFSFLKSWALQHAPR